MNPKTKALCKIPNTILLVGAMPNKFQTVLLISGTALLALGMAIKQFVDTGWHVSLALLIAAYILLGGQVVLRAARNILRGKVFDENFLMSIATMGAFAIGETTEAVSVMLFYQVGEMFQGMAVRKSKKSIASLMDIRPDYANALIGGELCRVEPCAVNVGDVIVVKPGEKIPLDGTVLHGEAMLDTAALTGESVPRRASVSDTVLSGCINLDGMLRIEATQTFGESAVAKIIALAQSAASKKAPTENFITKFARWYTPAVVGLAALLALAPPILFGGQWADWLNRSLIFLVVSCPCALVVSIPLGFFGGIGAASRKGILFKGGNYLEAMNSLDIVVFDKTGTLTKGVFKVTALKPASGFSEGELLEIAASAETFSSHPIAQSIIKEYGRATSKAADSEYREYPGFGVCLMAGGKTILAGSQKLMEKEGIAFEESTEMGTKAYIAQDGIFVGCIIISDEIRPDALCAVSSLKARGIRKTAMLTGDAPALAYGIARELGIDEAYGGLLPHQKVEKIEMLNAQKRPKGKLAFVGDGVNDAPVLGMADIGVAMGGLGSDAAIEAADVVLMTDEPSKLGEAMDIARHTRNIVWQNIVFALGVKTLFLGLSAYGVASMWEAIFADMGVALLAIFNAMRILGK